MSPRIVLDTNCVWRPPWKLLEEWKSAGVRVSISEVALMESWARSVREFEAGAKSRAAARFHLFGRMRKIAPYIDAHYPIAILGAAAIRRVQADADGHPIPEETITHIDEARHSWRVVVRDLVADELWTSGGQESEQFLARIDAGFAKYCRPIEHLLAERFDDSADRERARQALADPQDNELRRAMVAHVAEGYGSAAERLDAVIRVQAWRFLNADHLLGAARENDAPDMRLLVHLGEGAVVCSDDKKLVRLVDVSGTRQASWVRRPEDFVDALPEGMPWGASACAEHARFVRRSVGLSDVKRRIWPSDLGGGDRSETSHDASGDT